MLRKNLVDPIGELIASDTRRSAPLSPQARVWLERWQGPDEAGEPDPAER